jgi:phosphatidylserine/phosphatidylglycerophosphate/cardiolipin synthase-like enzyme
MMWFTWKKAKAVPTPDLFVSRLFDEKTFYRAFLQDLSWVKQEVIIDCPFMTINRLRFMKVAFEVLVNRDVRVIVVTKHPSELDESMAEQHEAAIRYFERLGVQVLLCKDHHRKLAIIDRHILWEGSLNILSQNRSREFMRRIDSKQMTEEMVSFLRYDRSEWFR